MAALSDQKWSIFPAADDHSLIPYSQLGGSRAKPTWVVRQSKFSPLLPPFLPSQTGFVLKMRALFVWNLFQVAKTRGVGAGAAVGAMGSDRESAMKRLTRILSTGRKERRWPFFVRSLLLVVQLCGQSGYRAWEWRQTIARYCSFVHEKLFDRLSLFAAVSNVADSIWNVANIFGCRRVSFSTMSATISFCLKICHDYTRKCWICEFHLCVGAA